MANARLRHGRVKNRTLGKKLETAGAPVADVEVAEAAPEEKVPKPASAKKPRKKKKT